MASVKKTKPVPVPNWKTWQFWAKIIAIIGPTIALLNYLNGLGCFPSKKEIEPEKTEQPDPGCGFPAHFVRDTLYVLITCFEDLQEEGLGIPYGKGIDRRINFLSDSLQLPIVTCYRKDLFPGKHLEADTLRKYFNADLVIWGKLKNTSHECDINGFCLQFEPSDTLITYAGGTVSKPKLDDYQYGISAGDVETELIRMGNEVFDDWLVDMFNLKIGMLKPEMFVIGEGWDRKKKVEGYFTRGSIWYRLGRYDKAIANADQAIALDPTYTLAYIGRGDTKMRLGRNTEAIDDYDRAIVLNPESAHAYNSRGNAKRNLGRYAAAIVDFDKAIAINPKEVAVIFYNRGVANIDLGQNAQAIADFDQFIAVDSKKSSAFVNRGYAKMRLGLYVEAIADFDQAVAINPKVASTYINRGAAKNRLRRHVEAISDFDHAITINPRYSPSYNERGVAKQLLGRFSEAIADFNQSIAIDPQKVTYENLEAARQGLEKKKKECRRNYALAFLFFTLVYFWKFKTINSFLTRAFQILKKRLRRP